MPHGNTLVAWFSLFGFSFGFGLDFCFCEARECFTTIHGSASLLYTGVLHYYAHKKSGNIVLLILPLYRNPKRICYENCVESYVCLLISCSTVEIKSDASLINGSNS